MRIALGLLFIIFGLAALGAGSFSGGFGDKDLARVRTPVGLDIGARTAEEIALSILAGIVADRHGAGGGWLDGLRTRPRTTPRR